MLRLFKKQKQALKEKRFAGGGRRKVKGARTKRPDKIGGVKSMFTMGAFFKGGQGIALWSVVPLKNPKP